MKSVRNLQAALVVAVFAAGSVTATAQIVITEVASWGSSTATYAADWFELTNIGTEAVDISNWKVDDNSNSFLSAVPLRGLTSISPGQTVVFIESGASNVNDATKLSAFTTAWFNGTAPGGFTAGFYGGTGLGLSSSSGDAVNIFNAAGTVQANVTFGATESTTPYLSFDNTAGANNVTLTTVSSVGVNGAFTAFDAHAVGSPGITPVPEPEEYAAALGAFSLAVAAWMRRQRR
jgi:hypothetical protein